MTPYMSLWKRVVAWLLWRYEGFDDADEERFGVIEHPELLRTTSLMRDYHYFRMGRES